MTELRGKVEPPFSKPAVQRTVASLALIVAMWQAMALTRLCWSSAARDHNPVTRQGNPITRQGRPITRQGREALAERAEPLIQIDLNRAEARELALIPRIGPVLARRIVEHRNRFGPFASVESLGQVPGIGSKTIDEIGRIGYVDSATLRDQ